MFNAAQEAAKRDRIAAQRLRAAGLRPTRQRVELAGLLFASGDRHMTAEALHAEATRAGVQVSLATVYNTLHQFTQSGTAAPGGGGRRAQLFRHQYRRAPAFLSSRTTAP